MTEYIQLGLLGLGSSAAYALLSYGLIQTYRASGVLNFSQGAMAMVAAYIFYELRVNQHMSFAPAAIITIAVLSAFGVAVYVLLIRPLRTASVLVRIFVTLGLLTALQAGATLKYSGSILFVPESVPHTAVHFGSVIVTSDRLWLIGIALALGVVLWLVSTYTKFGLATRAVAENDRASAAYGWSPDVIAASNWAIGAGLAALAGILIVPLSSLSVSSLSLLVIPALAVSVAAGFQSFPLVFVGAVFLGVAQGVSTKWEANIPGLPDLITLGLIMVAFVIRRQALPGRGERSEGMPSLGAVRKPLTTMGLILALGILLSLLLPVSWAIALGVSVVVGIIILSIVVLTGFAGQLSLGQYGLAGLGALVAAQLSVDAHWPFWIGLILGVAAAAGFGFVFGLPALRSRGAALAIVTLGVGNAINSVVFNNSHLAGGQLGFQIANLKFFGISINPVSHPRSYAIFALLWFAVAVWVVLNIRRSPAGRRLIALRSNERAAASLGISVSGAKLFAFVVSAGLAGLGGILLAFSSTSILLDQGFDPLTSIANVGLSVMGGIGHISGAVVGGELTQGGLPAGIIAAHIGGNNGAEWLVLAGGIGLLVTLRFYPSGIAAAPIPDPFGSRRRRKAAAVAAQTVDTEAAPARVIVPLQPKPDTTMRLDHLSVAFGGVHALSDVSLEVASGEVVGLIGPNGAGKTTLIDGVTGYVTATGEVWIGDVPLSKRSPHLRARAGITRSFQSLELFDDISVEDNLRAAGDKGGIGAYFRGLLPSRVLPLPSAARAAVEEFGLQDDLKKTPKELSYGKRKLVAIARGVAASPSFLMLDEPAAGLGDVETQELGHLVRRLAQEWNIGVLIIEHDVNLIMSISDRVAVLEFGVKIAEGTPREVRDDPKVIAAYLGVEQDDVAVEEIASVDANFYEAETGAVAVMEGPEPTAPGASPQRGRKPSAAPDVLHAHQLSAGYTAAPVIRDLEIAVRPGEVVALLGPNGAGKTTTVRCLAGQLKPMGGEILASGEQINSPLHRRARNGLGYLAEERSVLMNMTVEENLRLARTDMNFAYELFPELKKLARRRTGLLSGGEQQMLGVAAALGRKPSVLLADELSLGLAPLVVDRLLTAVRQAADTSGVGVLLVEQHARKALKYADYVYVLRRGQVVMEGTAAEMTGRLEELESAYLAQR